MAGNPGRASFGIVMRLLPIMPLMLLSACAERAGPFSNKGTHGPDRGGKAAIVEPAVLGAARGQPADRVCETFDAGVSLTDTYFSRVHPMGSGRFAMDRIASVAGAPSGDFLPVSAGGDHELRYSEGPGGIAATHSMAVAPATGRHVDSMVSGYMGTALTDTFGARTAGLMCRASGKGWALDAYVAKAAFGFSGHNTVSFSLSVMKGGRMHSSYTADRSGKFALIFEEENVYIELRAVGDIITASCWKVQATGEKVLLDTLTIRDDAYTSGAAGIYALARGDKALYFDDICAAPISPEP